MAFHKGQQKTPGSGRKKGTPNKKKPIVRQMLIDVTNDDKFWQKWLTELFSLEGRDFTHAAKEIFDIIEPKLQAVAVEGNLDSKKSSVLDIIAGLRDNLTPDEEVEP